MDICLTLAGGAALLLQLPAPLTLSWQHSVEHFTVEEVYQAGPQGLLLSEVRGQGLGAGLDVPPQARWTGGWWSFQPAQPPLPALVLANSRHAAGYRLCAAGRCVRLADIEAAHDQPVRLSPCAAATRTPSAP